MSIGEKSFTLPFALHGSYSLWSWLAVNPGKRTQEWSGWNISMNSYLKNITYNHCFACIYRDMHRGKKGEIVYCNARCILPVFRKHKHQYRYFCCAPGSPYQRWRSSGFKDVLAVQEIANSALSEWKKISK